MSPSSGNSKDPNLPESSNFGSASSSELHSLFDVYGESSKHSLLSVQVLVWKPSAQSTQSVQVTLAWQVPFRGIFIKGVPPLLLPPPPPELEHAPQSASQDEQDSPSSQVPSPQSPVITTSRSQSPSVQIYPGAQSSDTPH